MKPYWGHLGSQLGMFGAILGPGPDEGASRYVLRCAVGACETRPDELSAHGASANEKTFLGGSAARDEIPSERVLSSTPRPRGERREAAACGGGALDAEARREGMAPE